MLDLALKNGLDVNQVAPHGTHRSKGRALLHRAVANDPNARMVKWLLAHGADPSAKDHAGCTPMALLSKHPAYVAEEVRALLVEALALRQGPSEATPQAETKSGPAPKPRRP